MSVQFRASIRARETADGHHPIRIARERRLAARLSARKWRRSNRLTHRSQFGWNLADDALL
jgi:hypothetical protein